MVHCTADLTYDTILVYGVSVSIAETRLLPRQLNFALIIAQLEVYVDILEFEENMYHH